MSRKSSSVDVFLRLHGQRKFNKELVASGVALESWGLKGGRAIASFAASSEKLKSVGRSWTRNVTLPITVGAALSAKAAIDQESSFAGVRKTVKATERGYNLLERALRGMSLRIPVSANELNEIAEAAGQLGVQRKNLLGFTRVVADLGVATNLKGDEGATMLARFANITQMPQSKFDRLGSTIVALGNAGASTESDIAAMGLRIAAAGDFVGMSEPQILGYANALSSVGIEAEAGGSAISTAFKTINSAVAGGGSKLEAFAAIAGMSAGQFKKAWETDAAGASVAWIEGLARLRKEGQDIPAVLSALDPKLRGLRVQDTLLRASGAGDLLRQSLDLGTRSWGRNNALVQEARKRYETLKSKLGILKNSVVDLGVTVGQELLPPLADFAQFAGPLLQEAAHWFGMLPPEAKSTAIGVALLLAAFGPLTSVVGYFAGGVGRSVVAMARFQRGASGFLSILSSALAAGQGAGSFGIAFAGTGAAGAMQVAKGFALSLAPAIAAYGVGNIVTSALEGDWRDAGFEAGGAIAGGIAGFMLGGPLGAMIGVGVGSLGGELLSGLFDSGSKIPPLQLKLARSSKEVTRYFKEQKAAGRSLATATAGVTNAHKRLQESSKAVRRAEAVLTTTKRRSRSGSDAVAKAEWRLQLRQDDRIRTIRKLHRAERVQGQQLRWYKQIARSTVLEERNLVNNLGRRLEGIKRLSKSEVAAGAPSSRLTEIAKRGIKVSTELSGAQRKYKETLQEASQKAGPKFAGFLSKANRQSLEFGSALKVVNSRLRVMSDLTNGLSETEPFAMPSFSNFGPGPALPSGPPTPAAGPPAPGKQGHKRGRSQPPGTRPRSLAGSGYRGALQGRGETVHHTVLMIDGKVLAETVTQHSNKAANRE